MPRLSLRRLWQAAPVAFAGALASGLGMGAFWGMGAVYAERIGLDANGIAQFITVTILAGALLQWPMGRLSDRIDRRRALAIIAAVAAAGGLLMAALSDAANLVLAGAFVFGGGAFAVYPVIVAHLIDHLHHEDILSGNAGLLLLHGAAAVVGPAAAGALMGLTGPEALPVFFALMFGPAALFALVQSRRGSDEIVEDAAHFMPMLRTSATVLEMMTPNEPAASPAAAAHAQDDTAQAEDPSSYEIHPGLEQPQSRHPGAP
jgi:MFS family permease